MKMIKCILFLMFFSSHAYSYDDYEAIANEAKANAVVLETIYQKDALQAQRAMQNITAPYKTEAKQLLDDLNKSERLHCSQGSSKSYTALIFVSFSMPKDSLLAYLRDAKKQHAALVICGLINNSFQKTFRAVNDLVQESKGDGVLLNPLWFKKFKIKQVPAVVVINKDSHCLKESNCSESNYSVLYGDISLNSALNEIANRTAYQVTPVTVSNAKSRSI